MIAGKVWGTTESLLRTPFVSVDRLKIVPHAQCSLHCHEHKWNAFIVLSGKLSVAVHKRDYELVDVTHLGPGEMTIVRPGEYHRFQSGAEAVDALELYYPQELGEDIVRKDVGGRL